MPDDKPSELAQQPWRWPLEPVTARKNGITWTVTPPQDGQPAWDAPWDEPNQRIHAVWGFITGDYEVTRDDDRHWRAVLSIAATPVKSTRRFTAGSVTDIHTPPALYVHRVVIQHDAPPRTVPLHVPNVPTKLPAPITETRLPVTLLLDMAADAGLHRGIFYPKGSDDIARDHDTLVADRDRQLRDYTETNPFATGAKVQTSRDREILFRAVLKACEDWEHVGGISGMTRDDYVADKVHRSVSNIRRDIRSARQWETDQGKKRKKGKRK